MRAKSKKGSAVCSLHGLRFGVTLSQALLRDGIICNAKMAASVLSGVLRRLSRTAIRPIRSFHKPWPVSVLTRLKSSSTQPSSVENAKEVNWKCRQDLATAFRGLDWYGLGEGVCTHLTMMAPALSGDGEVMLMIPHGLHWSQVCNTFHSQMINDHPPALKIA